MTDGGAISINRGAPDMAAAATGAVGSALDADRGVASDAELMVGYSLVESMTTGIKTAVKSSEFQQLGFANIVSPNAKAELGALDLMGPAGSGAQNYQLSAQEVSFAQSAAAAAAQPTMQNIVIKPQPVYLDSQVVATIADQRIAVAFGKAADSYSRQRSA